jgi:hypothetical protein
MSPIQQRRLKAKRRKRLHRRLRQFYAGLVASTEQASQAMEQLGLAMRQAQLHPKTRKLQD